MVLGTRTSTLDRLARNLLATTCLTMAAGATAQAGVFNESTDLPNNPPPALLPVGTTEVNGGTDTAFSPDSDDYFQFVGLLPGSNYTLIFQNQEFAFLRSFLQISNTSGTILGEGAIFESGSRTFTGTVPDDGKLNIRVGAIEEGGGLYRVTLDAASDVPEPATVIPAGLALAGALAWQRRKQKST